MLDTRHHATGATKGGGCCTTDSRSFRHLPRSIPRDRATLGAGLAILPGRLVLSRRPGTRPQAISTGFVLDPSLSFPFRVRLSAVGHSTSNWVQVGSESRARGGCLARCASLRLEGRTPARSCLLVAERVALAFLCQEGEPRSNAMFAREKRGGGTSWCLGRRVFLKAIEPCFGAHYWPIILYN